MPGPNDTRVDGTDAQSNPGSTPVDTFNGEVRIDPVKAAQLRRRIIDNQNLVLGSIAGGVAAVVSAAAWGYISFSTGYQISYMALGVGFLVGLAMRLAGRGITQPFGIAGAALSLLGCVLGNLFAVSLFVAREFSMPVTDVLSGMGFEVAFAMLRETFEFIDLLFYGIAVYGGYKLSFRRLTEGDVQGIIAE